MGPRWQHGMLGVAGMAQQGDRKGPGDIDSHLGSDVLLVVSIGGTCWWKERAQAGCRTRRELPGDGDDRKVYFHNSEVRGHVQGVWGDDDACAQVHGRYSTHAAPEGGSSMCRDAREEELHGVHAFDCSFRGGLEEGEESLRRRKSARTD